MFVVQEFFFSLSFYIPILMVFKEIKKKVSEKTFWTYLPFFEFPKRKRRHMAAKLLKIVFLFNKLYILEHPFVTFGPRSILYLITMSLWFIVLVWHTYFQVSQIKTMNHNDTASRCRFRLSLLKDRISCCHFFHT